MGVASVSGVGLRPPRMGCRPGLRAVAGISRSPVCGAVVYPEDAGVALLRNAKRAALGGAAVCVSRRNSGLGAEWASAGTFKPPIANNYRGRRSSTFIQSNQCTNLATMS